MPDIGGQDRIVLVVVEHHELGRLAEAMERVHFQLAETLAERDVLLGRERLVAREDHLVLD